MTADLTAAPAPGRASGGAGLRYYAVTHRPLEWPLPAFVQPVALAPGLGEGVVDLTRWAPDLAGRDRTLGEYAALFALRRMLEAEWGGADAPAGDLMLGLAHFRRFGVTRTVGTPAGMTQLVDPTTFGRLPDEVFLPDGPTLVVPAPLDFGRSLLRQYGESHVVRDLLLFMGVAIDLGVVDDASVTDFLDRSVLFATPSVGVYPTEWLLIVLEALESVAGTFEAALAQERDGYQRRATGFCLERLHALLLHQLVAKWTGPVEAHQALLVTPDGVHRPGD
ncbi:hypothetical protein ACI8AA_13415 [Geodermatophilus sp. SYSU D01180]